MGTWGTKIEENDSYLDVYEEFMSMYNTGIPIKNITKKLEQKYRHLGYEDHDSLFAIAKAQWDCGQLDKKIYEKVKEIITKGKDIKLWKEFEVPKEQQEKRKKVLEEREKNLKEFLKKISEKNKKPIKKGEKQTIYITRIILNQKTIYLTEPMEQELFNKLINKAQTYTQNNPGQKELKPYDISKNKELGRTWEFEINTKSKPIIKKEFKKNLKLAHTIWKLKGKDFGALFIETGEPEHKLDGPSGNTISSFIVITTKNKELEKWITKKAKPLKKPEIPKQKLEPISKRAEERGRKNYGKELKKIMEKEEEKHTDLELKKAGKIIKKLIWKINKPTYYWVWEYKDQEGTKCYAYVIQEGAKKTYGYDENYFDLTPEEFIKIKQKKIIS